MKTVVAIATIFALSACASTTVTPVSRNQFILSTSAAPACGSSGAAKVASKMAAVETIRRGYQRYVVAGAASANNVSVMTTGPTYANTTGSAYSSGNRIYGSSTTTFGGQQTIFSGTHDSDLAVIMINPGEPGFDQAIDARRELGPDWQKTVQEGVNTCN